MEDFKLTWRGENYHIPANQVLPVIAKVENIVTLPELQNAVVNDTIPLAKLSMAYAVILRHAGAMANDREVYSGMFGADASDNAINAAYALLSLMIPPEHLPKEEETAAEATKKKTAAKKGASSKKPTKPQSDGD